MGKQKVKGKDQKTFYLSRSLNELLKKRCKAHNMSQSDFIESLISKSLRAN